MSIRVVADTHTVLWYLYNDTRLSVAAGTLLDATDAAGDQVAMASIVLAEVIYLIEKGRIDVAAFERILAALNRVDATLVEVPLDRFVVQAMRRIDRTQVPDLPDRIVAAAGLHLGVPVISRDRKIRSSIVTTISKTNGARLLDGLIIPDGVREIRTTSEVDVRGKHYRRSD